MIIRDRSFLFNNFHPQKLKVKKKLHLLGFIVILFFVLACQDDDHPMCVPEVTGMYQERFDAAKGFAKYDIIEEFFSDLVLDSALVTVAEHSMHESYFFEAENGKMLCVPAFFIRTLNINSDENKLELNLRNDASISSAFFIPWTSLTLDSLVINPFKSNPLCAAWHIQIPEHTELELIIRGKSDVADDFAAYFTLTPGIYEIPILGLYASHENKINVLFKSHYGSIFYEKELEIPIPELEVSLPIVEIISSDPGEMKKGLNFVSSRSHPEYDVPFAFDKEGEIRWLFDFKDHPVLNRIFYDVGIERLENGNWYFGDIRLDQVFEIGMLGNLVNSWDLGEYQFHHKVQEKKNGNLLVSVSKPGSLHDNGKRTNQDYIIELDRTTGAIINTLDLKLSLDEYRTIIADNLSNAVIDWIHVNAIYPDESDNSIILSGRLQGVMKLTEDNQVKWILAPHFGWNTDRSGRNLNQFLLTPLDNTGSPITDTMVLKGYTNHPDFEWNWAQHSIQRIAGGKYILFDNGDQRNLGSSDDYSRIVEYIIDEEQMTVQQTWSYGKELGSSCYSRVASNVEFDPSTDNFFMHNAVGISNPAGSGGKTTELDRSTQKIVFQASITMPGRGFTFHRIYRYPLYPK